MRLFSLVLAVAMVGFLIRELGRQQGAVQVDQAVAADADANPVADSQDVLAQPDPAPADAAQFRSLLDLAGWDAKRFATLQSSGPLTDMGRVELAELLWRLRTFDGPQLAAWAEPRTTPEHAGELVELTGRVTTVARHVLPADVATRHEMPAYFECKMKLDDGHGLATLITGRVPNAWLKIEPLDEPAEAAGVFIRRLPTADGVDNALFVSREIAWHPVTPHEPFVSRGGCAARRTGRRPRHAR